MGLFCNLPDPSGCDTRSYLTQLQDALCAAECNWTYLRCVECGVPPFQFDDLWGQDCPVPTCAMVIELCDEPVIWIRNPVGDWRPYQSEAANELIAVPCGTPTNTFYQYFLRGVIPAPTRGAIAIELCAPPRLHVWTGFDWQLAGRTPVAAANALDLNMLVPSPQPAWTPVGPLITLAADGFTPINICAQVSVLVNLAFASFRIQRDGVVLPSVFNDGIAIATNGNGSLGSVDLPPIGNHTYQVYYTVTDNPGGGGASVTMAGHFHIHGWGG
jgi:hypothetical protein